LQKIPWGKKPQRREEKKNNITKRAYTVQIGVWEKIIVDDTKRNV